MFLKCDRPTHFVIRNNSLIKEQKNESALRFNKCTNSRTTVIRNQNLFKELKEPNSSAIH